LQTNQNKIHIAVLCETWLQSTQLFNIKGYFTERLDSGNKYNGVAILVQHTIKYTKLLTSSDNSLQNIAIQEC
jgi:hypothetical protein